jgi:hypothetical protein
MPAVVPFYSLDEKTKPSKERVYHNHTECPIGRAIPDTRRCTGTDGYELCPVCFEFIQHVRRKSPKSVT